MIQSVVDDRGRAMTYLDDQDVNRQISLASLQEEFQIRVENLDKGTFITESDLLIRKPGTGLSSKYKKKLIGKKIKKKYLKFEIISKNEVF